MYKSGMKVTVNRGWTAMDYPELTQDEYTVAFSYMTDSFTWIILREFPGKQFNSLAFHGEGEEFLYGVRTTYGGILISDIEYLDQLLPLESVLGYEQFSTVNEVLRYFSGCAVCGKECRQEPGTGCIPGRCDMLILPVCSDCCHQSPGIKVVFPNQLTWHDVEIDWWDELKAYGEMIGQPDLCDLISQEMESKCEICKKCDCCSCPNDFPDDYLEANYHDLYEKIKPWAEERLRLKYPDPQEQ